MLIMLEYSYGATEEDVSGIFAVEPHQCPNGIFRVAVDLGEVPPPLLFPSFSSTLFPPLSLLLLLPLLRYVGDSPVL